MTKQIKNVYITDQAGLNQILLSIADRLDLLEGWRPALSPGYLLIDDDSDIGTTDELLTPDEILGTTNRITITDNGDGTITISTPQDTDTNADVEFDSLVLDDLTASRMVSTDSNKKLVSIANLTSWITGTANQVTVTNDGDGTITLSLPQSINTNADVEFDSLTLGDMTLGSIIFAGTSGLLSQDNANLFWDNTNKRLGIGTTAPVKNLDVDGVNGQLIVGDSDNVLRRVIVGSQSGYPGIWLGTNTPTTSNYAFLGDSGTGTIFNAPSGKNLYFRIGNSNKLFVGSNGNVGIGTLTPTAYLHLKAGTAAAGTAPLKMTDGTLLTTEEAGALEYTGGKLYFTNVGHRRVLDRTSDVAVETVTVANTTTETLLWYAHMGADSLKAGNVFKFHADGIIQNDGAAATEEVTLRIRVGGSGSGALDGTVIATLNPTTKAIAAGSHWHINANATQRTIGAVGSRAVHIDLDIDGTTEEVIAVANIDTTVNMDVVVSAEWASADVNNTISLYQGFMEYKN